MLCIALSVLQNYNSTSMIELERPTDHMTTMSQGIRPFSTSCCLISSCRIHHTLLCHICLVTFPLSHKEVSMSFATAVFWLSNLRVSIHVAAVVGIVLEFGDICVICSLECCICFGVAFRVWYVSSFHVAIGPRAYGCV